MDVTYCSELWTNMRWRPKQGLAPLRRVAERQAPSCAAGLGYKRAHKFCKGAATVITPFDAGS